MVYATIIQFSKQFVRLYVKISIKSRPGKKRQSLEHIFCTSKYQRGIDFIFKNNCQSDLKEMTSWGSTYFFHFCGRVSSKYWGPRWQSGNTLASHLCGRGSIPVMAVSGKAGSCLPLVGSLQYTSLANYMYWFPLPFQLPVVI